MDPPPTELTTASSDAAGVAAVTVETRRFAWNDNGTASSSEREKCFEPVLGARQFPTCESQHSNASFEVENYLVRLQWLLHHAPCSDTMHKQCHLRLSSPHGLPVSPPPLLSTNRRRRRRSARLGLSATASSQDWANKTSPVAMHSSIDYSVRNYYLRNLCVTPGGEFVLFHDSIDPRTRHINVTLSVRSKVNSPERMLAIRNVKGCVPSHYEFVDGVGVAINRGK